MEQVDILNEWAYNHKKRAIAKYAAAALELAEKGNNLIGASDAHIQLGAAAENELRYKTAALHFETALRERLRLKHYGKSASAYNRLSQVKTKEGQYHKAIDWAQKGLSLMADQPPHVNTAYLYQALGNAAKFAGRFAQADSAFHAGLQLYGQLTGEAAGQASLRMSYAAFLQECRYLYTPAKDSLLKSWAFFAALDDSVNTTKCLLLLGNNAYYMRQLDSAALYYERGLQMGNQTEPSDYHILLKNRGRVRMEQGKYQPAYSDFQTALHFFVDQQDTANIARVLSEIGHWHYEQSQLDSAIIYYKQATPLPWEDPMQRGRLLFFLSDALSQIGQSTEANHYTDAYLTLLNNLNDPETRGIFETLNRLQLEKSRLFTRLQTAEKEQIKRMGLLGAGCLSTLLLLALSAVRLNRQKRRIAEAEAEKARQQKTIALQIAEKAENEQEIARQNEQIAIQEKLELIKNRELETHYARLEAQDDLQKQIGRDLHDGIGAMLTAVKLNLSPVDEVLDRFPDEKRTQYSNANRLLDEACQELRRVSHELGSAILTQFGLKAQLEAFANILKESGKFEVELNLHGLEGRFDKKMEVNIYRIIQELIGNIIKHAQANKIIIQTNHLDNMINIMVEDDGKGFDLEKAKQKPGQGLISIEARVHDLKGVMFIDTRLKRGTVVSIDIPLFPKDV
jgi:signal transduction histidine kinase